MTRISHVKQARAFASSRIGSCAGSAGAMLDRVPAAIQSALTGAQLGSLLDAMWDACQEAKGIAETEAISTGYVWDAARNELREIAAPAA